MKNKKRKPQAPDEEGSPAWMNTYGDMVTLLLAFFVLLFSFSTIDAEKWKKIVSSLSGSQIVAIEASEPNNVQTLGIMNTQQRDDEQSGADEEESGLENESAGNAETVKKRFNELYEQIQNHIEKNKLENKIHVSESEDTILIRMTDSALFDSGRDEIKSESEVILLKLCDIIQDYTNLIKEIQIEGHTDNVPISTAEFEDNLALSSSRAEEVVRYFIRHMDINPSILTPLGRSEYHPVESNDTEEGKKANRRVDFVIESVLKE